MTGGTSTAAARHDRLWPAVPSFGLVVLLAALDILAYNR